MELDLASQPIAAPAAVTNGTGQSQPVQALGNLDPQLDDAAVRAAIAGAEQSGLDPQSLTLADLAQGPAQEPAKDDPSKLDVPQKFLKPDGAVDVEKLTASTKQLDEAIQKKEEAAQKSVEDYLKAYKDKENKFRNLPNPDRLAPPVEEQKVAPAAPATISEEQFMAQLQRDLQTNLPLTITNLVDAAVAHRIGRELAPVKGDLEMTRQEREQNRIRTNLSEIAAKDPRIMNERIFSAINAKLESDPDLWKLKNPHKAAYLEVKEELRLGEFQAGTQAQPSKPLSPVLGGGTPPSTPSSSVQSPDKILANLDKIDLRDKRQEAMADAAIRAMLQGAR